METLTVSQFRGNMAFLLNKVDAGEQVILRRNKKMYTLVPVDDDDIALSDDLLRRMELARKEIKEGNCVSCQSKSDIQNFLDTL